MLALPNWPHLEIEVRKEDQSCHTHMEQAQQEQADGAQHHCRVAVLITLQVGGQGARALGCVDIR